MKPRNLVAAAIAAAFVLGPVPLALAQTQDHVHADAPPALTLDLGKRWQTDAPLRKHMTDLRASFAKDLGRIHDGTLPPADYAKLGATVEAKVASIINDCKLPPAADAQLHLIVADLIAGADVMQGKAAGAPAAGAHTVVTALNHYAQYFDHPGFKPLG
ncbi:MAG TPA: hypothetical protein VGL52_00030 [Casimicrobiaceae bacterium]|jgi:hypothetical protein